ncbi:hypothetical protein HYU19_05510 [Candidatus Woesearchaeota archaeon]|nr:hypothetical protein [Candidatus Woesearchaeota archaeon]
MTKIISFIYFPSTAHYWSSLFEFYQAGKALDDVLRQRPWLYTDEEREKAGSLRKKIQDKMYTEAKEGGTYGIVADTSVLFFGNAGGIFPRDVFHKYSRDDAETVARDVGVPEGPSPVPKEIRMLDALENGATAAYARALLSGEQDIQDSSHEILRVLSLFCGGTISLLAPEGISEFGNMFYARLWANKGMAIAAHVSKSNDQKMHSLGVDVEKYREMQRGL